MSKIKYPSQHLQSLEGGCMPSYDSLRLAHNMREEVRQNAGLVLANSQAMQYKYPELVDDRMAVIDHDPVAYQLMKTMSLLANMRDCDSPEQQRNFFENKIESLVSQTDKRFFSPEDGQPSEIAALNIYSGFKVLDEYIKFFNKASSIGIEPVEDISLDASGLKTKVIDYEIQYPTPMFNTENGLDFLMNSIENAQSLLSLYAKRQAVDNSNTIPEFGMDDARWQLMRFMHFTLDAGEISHRSKKNREEFGFLATRIMMKYFPFHSPSDSRTKR